MKIAMRVGLVALWTAASVTAGWVLHKKATPEALYTAYAKYIIGQPSHKQNLSEGVIDTVVETDYAVLNGVTSQALADQRRAAMAAYIFRGDPQGMTRRPDEVETNQTFLPLQGLQIGSIDVLTVDMPYGINSKVYFLHAAKPRSCLMIYQEGHRVSFLARSRYLDRLVADGCDVLALSLPLTGGMNSRPLIDHPRLGRVLLNDPDDLQLLDSAGYSSLSYFITPLVAALNHALDQRRYDLVGATGFSGGGWAVQVLGALDPRIQVTYSVAGSAPAAVHAAKPEWGSPEQREGRFYEIANYPEIYVMSADRPGRRHLQFYNQTDPCCFGGENWKAWSGPLADAAQRLGGQFRVLTYQNNEHTMSKSVALAIIDDFLNGGHSIPPGITPR